MSFIDNLGTWLLRKALSAIPPPNEGDGRPKDPAERLRQVWLREDEYALLVTILLERFPGRDMAEAMTSKMVRRRREVRISAPQRDLEVVADALHELVTERRAESLALLENLDWADRKQELEWSSRSELTRRLSSLRDAIIHQCLMGRGNRF